MQNFWRFFRRVFRYWNLLAIALVASLIEAACTFSGFGTLMWVIDQLLGGKQSVRALVLDKLGEDRLGTLTQPAKDFVNAYVPADPFWGFVMLLGVIIGLTVLGSTMRFIHHVFTANAVMRTIIRLRLTLYRRLLAVRYENYAAMGPADMISRCGADCGAISQGIQTLLGKTVRNLLMGVSMLLLALIIDWKLTLLFLLGMPMIGLVIRQLGRAMKRITRRTLQYSAKMLRTLQETMLNNDIIKLQQAEGYARRRLHRVLVRQMLVEQLRAVKVRAITSPIVETFSIVAVAGVAAIAAWYVFSQDQEPTTLVKVLVLLGIGASSLKPLADLNNEIQSSAAAADRVAEVLELPLEQEDEYAKPLLPRHTRSIDFEGAEFAYPGSEHLALKGVDLHVDHGMTIAIVGPNGAGKSTLVNLLPRLMDATGGRVLVDGVDIKGVRLRSLRKQIAVVSQQATLFQGTIAGNISLGRQHVDREQIIAAGKAAYADEFIQMMPQGYDSVLTEGGKGALRRATAAGVHRAGDPPRPGHPHPRRSDQPDRHRIRSQDQCRAQAAPGRPDHLHHRPPPLHRGPRGPHRSDAGRRDHRPGQTRRTAAHQPPLRHPMQHATRRQQHGVAGAGGVGGIVMRLYLAIVLAREVLFHAGTAALLCAAVIDHAHGNYGLSGLETTVKVLMVSGFIAFIIGVLPANRQMRVALSKWSNKDKDIVLGWTRKVRIYASVGVIFLSVVILAWCIQAVTGEFVIGREGLVGVAWLLGVGFLYKAYDYRSRGRHNGV